ncbi:dihydrofolate reductase [Paucibacter sp. Y2R2-4]|uniref:dihydrofolate reductase n=1 Tax=Paucibacter sp. Y2R2-4 TaxID=2893553 RepID=UPI0021E3B6C8|nr:dihydrofolate reductase [Paucibacter sp. Y2R2-4]MCV2348235.1 dihydrofolate reductase [Paucibacter sp. Y2R2-4]
MTTLTLIAGVARGGAIGRGNELIFRVPEDMAHFKALTLGHTVIMGRKTWDSIPPRFRPLVERRNLVLTRQSDLTLDGAEVFTTLQAALDSCAHEDEVFVMGGAEIYALALPLADRLELTEFDAEAVGADAFFPAWRAEDFEEVSRQTHFSPAERGHGWPYHFVRYQRRNT